MKLRRCLRVTGGLVILVLLAVASQIGAQSCQISSFSVTPANPISLESEVVLEGSSNCRAVRFEINGVSRGEVLRGNQTLRIEATNLGVGSFGVCFVAQTGESWADSIRSCIAVSVTDGRGDSGSTMTALPTTVASRTSVPSSTPLPTATPIPPTSTPYPSSTTQPTDTRQPTRTLPPTTRPSETPRPAATSIIQPAGSCANAYSQLRINQTAIVSDRDPAPARVRRNPSTSAAQIDSLGVLTVVVIEDGPECADGWVWWYVTYAGGAGWVAEVDSRGLYNLVPSRTQAINCPRGVHVPLQINGYGRVTPGGLHNNIRSGPGTSHAIIGAIQPGERFRVLDGPRCGNGIPWWLVEYNGIEGWTAASGPDGAWTMPD